MTDPEMTEPEIPPTPHDPKSNLDKNQLSQLEEMRSLVFSNPLTQREKQFCDDACLLRYLRARDWNVKKSYKMLMDTLEWRRTYRPDEICAEELRFEASTGKMFRRGFDYLGRPILYLTPARENSTNYENNLKLLVYTMEQAIASMAVGVEQMVWMIDFEGYSAKHAVPLSVAKEVLNILSNHYPERLGLAFVISAPLLFSIFFTTIKPFIHPITRKKIHFVGKTEGEKIETLSKYMDMSQIEKRFGGTNNFIYNIDEFWSAEIVFEKERKAKLLPDK